MRIRVEWSSEAAAVWSAVLAAEGGELSAPVSLGTAEDEAGTIWSEGHTLKVARRSAAADDGVELSLCAPGDSLLRVLVHSTEVGTPGAPLEIKVSDLYRGTRVFEAAENRPRIVVRRAPGDALPLRVPRPHLVFDPGETFPFEVGLNLLQTHRSANKPVRAELRWKLYPQGATRSVGEGATHLSAIVNSPTPAEARLEVPLPLAEGVYQLRLTAAGHGFDDVERSVQLVVLGCHSTGPDEHAGIRDRLERERLVDSFEISKSGMSRRVAPAPRREGALARWWKRRPHAETHAAGLQGEQPNWNAYRLHVDHPGRPHRLTVRMSAGQSGQVGVCVLEAGLAGRWSPSGPDRICQLEAEGAAGSGSGSPELIFWPNDREPVVLVHHLDTPAAPEIERIELSELPALADTTAQRSASAAADSAPRRLCGPYISRPDLADVFGAPPAHDGVDPRPFDDWQTFLVAGRRLTETLGSQRANAVLMAAVSDGTALYPSRHCDSSLRFDTGPIAAAGLDPLRKDVLELLLRLCDQQGLVLIPEIQLNARLPAVERLIRESNSTAEGLELVGSSGQPWRSGSGGRAGSGYNALDPRVQQAVLDLVRELVDRYRRHPALGGLALDAGPASCLQVPGLEWGYDTATLRRFEQASGVRIPRADGPQAAAARYDFLTTTARREWLAWRAGEIMRFQQRIVEAVTGALPGGRVLLTGSGTLPEGSDGALPVSTILRTAGHSTQQLLERGLDFASAQAPTQLTVLRPAWTGARVDPLQRAALTTLNHSPAIDAAYRAPSRGSVSYGLTRQARLALGNELIDHETARRGLPTQATATSHELRQRWTHALAALDARVIFEAGAVLPVSQAGPEVALRRAITHLPDVPFLQVGSTAQPLAVRVAHAEEATWVCLVNPTSLGVSGALTLGCPAATPAIDLATGHALELSTLDAKRSVLSWQLGAFEILCCRLNHAQAGVLDSKVVLGEPALAALRGQIGRLHGRMSTMAELARSSVAPVSNAGFEEGSDPRTAEPVPGWNVPLENAGWSLDETNPRSGRFALRLSTENGNGTLVSPPLSLERARQATLTLWMRSSRAAARVQLSLEEFGAAPRPLQRQVSEVGKSWQKFEFRVAGLPFDGNAAVQLRVQPLDSGKVWIDDLELDVQMLSADDLKQMTKTASAIHLAWEQQRYADCERLLQGYWGRFLLEEAGEPAPAAVPVAAPAVPEAPQRTAAKPRFGSRVKQFLQR